MTKQTADDLQTLIDAAREKAFVLYEGVRVPHRSCGIAIAETFGLETTPYQALRRGGITGEGECGAIKAGELILGQVLGDADPTGGVTDALREGMLAYRAAWIARLPLGESVGGARPVIVCNHLTEPLGDFMGERRKAFCTGLASEVAAIVAEVLGKQGHEFGIEPVDS
jgi:hypothetical protein